MKSPAERERNFGTAQELSNCERWKLRGVSRSKSPQSQERMKKLYGELLNASGRVVGQARRFVQEIADGVKHSPDVLKQAALEGMKQELETMIERVKQVRRQTRKRVFG